MVSYCQVEGINTFFVVEVSAAAINSYETDMLYNNFVEGIIQPEFRAINGDMFIYCKINGMKSLDDISDRGIMSMEQAVALIRSLCSVVMETGEYMLEPDNLLIESDKIFYSDAEKSFRYVYVPGQGTDVRMGIKNLVEKIIKRVDHRDTELVDFMYEIYDMVVSAAEGDFTRAAERRGDFGGYHRVWVRCVRRNSSFIIYIAQQGGKAADQRAKQRHASASILAKRTSA